MYCNLLEKATEKAISMCKVYPVEYNTKSTYIMLSKNVSAHKVYAFGEGVHCIFATPNPFVLTNKICLSQDLVYADFLLLYINYWVQNIVNNGRHFDHM